VTLGEFPHVSLQEARLKVGEHKSMLARDIDLADERSRKRDDLTFSNFARDHYVPHSTMHKKTWQEDVYKIGQHILPILGNFRLSSITVRDVTALHTKVKESTTVTTSNHYLTLVRRMLNLAVKWGLLEKSPAAGLEKFRKSPHRERYLTKEELAPLTQSPRLAGGSVVHLCHHAAALHRLPKGGDPVAQVGACRGVAHLSIHDQERSVEIGPSEC